MDRQRMTILVIAAFVFVAGGDDFEGRQTPDLATSVAHFYPQVLVDESQEIDGEDPPRKQCFAVLEAMPSGAPKIVIAGYSNLISGAVRLLRAVDSGFEVAAEPDGGYATGWGCELETVDVNNDGRKEAVVRFQTRDSSVDWLFDWDGEQLRNLTPTVTDGLGLVRTSLLNASFIDVDGDKVMELFTESAPPREGQPLPGSFYRLVGGAYQLDRSIVSVRSFERASGTPRTDTDTILLPVGAVGPFTLRIVNGAGTTGSGKRVENAVESGRVWWNGQEIASPNHFGSHIAVIERTVTLQSENELKVRLAGSPDGRIVIMIDAASWTP